MKLIDKDALVAEIERRKREHDEKKYDWAISDHFWASVEYIGKVVIEPNIKEQEVIDL